MRIFLTAACMAFAVIALAQRPKLDLKVYGGGHTHILRYKDGNKTTDILHGWQAGFGFRVTYRKLMGEVDFNFVRNNVLLQLPDSIGTGEELVRFKPKAFELPIKVGVIPVKTAVFKWYAYTGLSLRFNTKGKLIYNDEEYTFKPKDVGLTGTTLDFLIGTAVDIGSFTIECTYYYGITNSIREDFRANSHELHFNFGFWF